MNDSKLTTIILTCFIIMFITLMLFGCLYIYNDYKDTSDTEKNVNIVEEKEINKQVIVDDKETEKEILKIQPVDDVKQNDNNQETIVINKFYYNQLNNYSKLIYKSLEEQKDKLKTGSRTIKLPNKISKILESDENNVEAIFSIAVNAFEYDNPDLFYLDSSKIMLYYERDTSGNYNIYLKNNDQFRSYLVDGFNNKDDVEHAQKEIEEIVKQIKEETTSLNIEKKIQYVHDWLVKNIEYDETLKRVHRSDIYGAFVEKKVTCMGYTKAFKYLMDRIGIDCIIIQGTATSEGKTENHAWNYIQINNKWYGIDCTWDDPVIIGGSNNGTKQKSYTYYLKGQNVFNNSHKPFETFYATNVEISYPKLEQNNFLN